MNKQQEIQANELAKGEPQVEELLHGLQRLDRYARRMQLLSNEDSMLSHLVHAKSQTAESTAGEQQEPAGHEGQGLLTALAEMIDRLEQHVGWVMQAMNRWCLSVLALEFALLLLLGCAVTVMASMLGNGQPLPVLQGWWSELLARPLSLTVYSVLLFGMAAMVHFKLRKRVARRIATALQQEEPFDTSSAFLRNTRIWHSIYRPQPVGWANGAQRQVDALRKELTDKVVHQSPDKLH